MPTFIDESGDAGPEEHSSRFFQLAAVWFETYDHADAFVEAIARLRVEQLKVRGAFEFHFVDNNHQQRVAFFEAAAEHSFLFTACSLDKNHCDRGTLTKKAILQPCIRHLAGELHDYFLIAEAEKSPAPLHERVVYDASRDPDFIHLLKEEFKALPSGRGRTAKLIKSVKAGKAKADTRIQLADMVCGAVRWHLEGDSTYFKMIEKRALPIGVLPG